jgi:hypothetical protein
MLNRHICYKCHRKNNDSVSDDIDSWDRSWTVEGAGTVCCYALPLEKHGAPKISINSVPPSDCPYKFEHAVAAGSVYAQ